MSAAAHGWQRDVLYTWFTERRWQEDDYLLFAGDHNVLVELADGRVVLQEIPSPRHQTIVLNLATRLRAFDAVTLIASTPVRLSPGKMREPDVMLFLPEHRDRIGEKFVGPPDLVVEVLSPTTRDVDLGAKMLEYAAAGIPEYWTVDPEAAEVAVFVQEGTGYRLRDRHGRGATIRSGLDPGIAIRVDDVLAA